MTVRSRRRIDSGERSSLIELLDPAFLPAERHWLPPPGAAMSTDDRRLRRVAIPMTGPAPVNCVGQWAGSEGGVGSIFISYRRADTAGYGGRLHEALVARFGSSGVFRDIDAIQPGTDFAATIEDAPQQTGERLPGRLPGERSTSGDLHADPEGNLREGDGDAEFKVG